MSKNCARCGKKMGFLERHSDHFASYDNALRQGLLPEYVGKNVCYSCQFQLVPSPPTPKVTQKSLTDIKCEELEDQFQKGLKKGRRIVVIKDSVLTPDGIGKHISKLSEIGEKYGYILKSETHTNGAGLSSIYLTLIFEKLITAGSETKFINCNHCTTRYDANQYFKCPNCGAPAA